MVIVQIRAKKNRPESGRFCFLAETVGFEPTEDLHPQRISSPLHSASLPRFRKMFQPKRKHDEVKPNKNADALYYFIFIWFLTSRIGGSGEIRTHGGLSTLDGFQDRCIKPLCHASVFLKSRNNNEVYTFCQALFSENT